MSHWIIGLVIIGVVVVGGSYALMPSLYSLEKGGVTVAGDVTGDGTDNAAAKVTDKSTPKLMESIPFSGSWNDLVKRGGTYVCEVNHSSAVDISSGTVHVSGTDVRGAFTSKTAAEVVESNLLKKGDVVYVWGGGMPQGIKMKASAMEGQSSTGTTGDVDQNQKYDWNCNATAPDASMFALPAGIEFMDIGAMMQGMGSVPGMPGR
jgi:hypothetical protein